jgi:uncharacterized cofD-like protein
MTRVVALGGGHGLAATLSALRRITPHITAIVTVADDGGSSGRLRSEFGVMPPGDLRMALAALCSDDAWGRSWAEAVQYRFPDRFPGEGEVGGHNLGNLMLSALWDVTGDVVAGLDRMGALLRIVGRVLPMSAEPLTIEAQVLDEGVVRTVVGQVSVATTHGRVLSVELTPKNPPATEAALTAIGDAEWIILGPGSWYSSVLPHLLVPAQLDALLLSQAKRVLVMNLDAGQNSGVPIGEPGEAIGLTAVEHLELLSAHAPELRFDFVIVDPQSLPHSGDLAAFLAARGSQLILSDVAMGAGSLQHDPAKLALLLAKIFS